MLFIFEAILFIAGIFFFKGRVKNPIWETIKNVLIIIFLEYFLIWRAVDKGWYEVMDGIYIWVAIVILYVGVIVYRFKDRKYEQPKITPDAGEEE